MTDAIRSMKAAGKPIGALCISPVLLTKVLGNIEVTIGNDPDCAAAIASMGGRHFERGHGEVVVDLRNRVATSPCYMLDATIAQIAEGAEHVVAAVLEMAKERAPA